MRALIIDGNDPKTESGEAQLVREILQRKFETTCLVDPDSWGESDAIGGNDLRCAYVDAWDLVWFTGHCAVIWRGSKPVRARLERRTGCVFRQLATADEFAERLRSRLVVMSSCRTVPGSRFFPHFQRVESAIGYGRKITTAQGLVFAATFASALVQRTRRDRLERPVIEKAFRSAQRLNSFWRMVNY